ncbi:efflux RND transporter permease subunit [Stenotrophomonas maltophilia]|uniref:efflux RND transporter permease subunit n=1 Tax=Stenotrophomonas maltophilia group TaxID=995085 RepID=UPI0006AA52BC|nr:efflux RND transporter permease subunit [Stenotrophomonas maltophilia]ALA83014.1 RND transporter [Stenotrophomonas maltophilia]MBH1478542.1 efflux RND transporter permease subunit [Stenotrophomonas maltophilia]MBH1503053.1 efflux RND transporter permease subunit [Stenotrophomonas maltophilia]MBH1787772.1 efflux RND transporter permease subunit [Stenotrophomonas maltophilia]
MLGLVRTALNKPYTFVVMAIFICIVGPLSALRTPTDVFPDIGIPVIAVVWQYTGLSPDAMAGRVISPYERALSTTVNDIEHIESQSLAGMGVVKVFFQPGVDIRTANAQITAISQTIVKQMPAGMTPPLILNYSASTVPVLQMAFSSPTLGESQIRDLAQNTVRPPLTSIPGLAIPAPYGGRQRQITLDLDPQAMAAKGLSAQDVGNALAAQNQITPVGTAKLGSNEFTVLLNNSPSEIEALNDLPIRTVNGAVVTIGQVAHVRDGSPPQTNIVRVNGGHSVLMAALKNGDASTLTLVSRIRAMLPQIGETLPPSLKISLLGDASTFVRESISSVAREGIIAALLTSVMILVFLGSWRSTVIIAASIPLAVLSAIALLSAAGQTLNVMTLGGLALAVGILVDDATVTIENVNWHLEQGKGVREAILDGAAQIVGPAFVSLLCICIVFVPMFLLDGIAGYLFRPMALAVIFAMASSFVLSRTLVPTMALYLLRPHRVEGGAGHHPEDAFLNHHEGDHPQPRRARMAATLVRWQQRFEAGFSATRDRYHALLGLALAHRGRFLLGFMACVLVSFALLPTLGQDFFPATEASALSLHVRLPLGTRIEETAAAFDRIEARIRQELPPQEIDAIVDNLGLPMTGINMAYSATGTIGPQDGDIQVSLKPGHGDAAEYARRLREVLPSAFPGASFAFLPADTSSQILNFGSPAPLDVRIAGPDAAGNRAYAQELQRRLRHVPGLVDLRLQQPDGYPTLKVDVDRLRANGLGITERDVTNSMVASLAGSGQVAPTFWLSPKNGISYSVVAATPQYRMDSLAALQALPVTGSGGGVPQVLGGLAEIQRGSSSAVVTHYNVQPTLDVYASVQGRDLGAVAADVQKVIDGMAGQRPRGTEVGLHGQIDALHVAFSGLGYGLLAAIVLIYLLIVINFQSWTDPFVIITALPAGLAGVVWMLFLTHTTLSVPALTGAILCMGVATANSILVVSFCRERLAEHGDAVKAALEGGFTRFRPVCMTALAMILGMLPTALSTEQNAPLGRAVIGGLLLATCATLLFVPVVFALAHSRKTRTAPAGEPLHV